MSTRDRLPIKRRDLSAFWQSALVLAPLLLLTVLGVRGLQLSKRATLDRARAECERATAALLERFRHALPALARECVAPALCPEAPVPAAANDAQELFRTASSQPIDASAIWKQLAEEHRDALAESGVPLLPLVCWAQLRNASSPAESQLFAEELARAAVETHPSVLTPELLARLVWLMEHGADLNMVDNLFVNFTKEGNESATKARHTITPTADSEAPPILADLIRALFTPREGKSPRSLWKDFDAVVYRADTAGALTEAARVAIDVGNSKDTSQWPTLHWGDVVVFERLSKGGGGKQNSDAVERWLEKLGFPRRETK